MKLLRRILQFPLHVWHRLIAPMFPPMCRYEPSCSMYAVDAIEKHRLDRAFVLIVRRVVSCAPWNPGGFDPVPEPDEVRGLGVWAWRRPVSREAVMAGAGYGSGAAAERAAGAGAGSGEGEAAVRAEE